MAFTINLHRFQDGEGSAAESAALRRVLQTRNVRGPDGEGRYIITFLEEGVPIVFEARGLEDRETVAHCYFHVPNFEDFGPPGMDSKVARLIYDIALAGDFVLLLAQVGRMVVLVRREQEAHLSKEIADSLRAVYVANPDELHKLLVGDGPGPWYRAKIITY